jgi:HD-like signal output (HDOD) protein/ActR/RegA family two-component response regulator
VKVADMENMGTPPKKILFVDDDPNVLAGLRNALRPQHREWDMAFANGPDEALAKVAEKSFDVVVSDMRMPRMDGAALLARVKQLQPKAIRMILSGQTELESVVKSVFVAHMFLSKPCDPSVLRNVIGRACQLNSILNSDDLRGAAGKVEMLPSAPKTYMALNEALAQPNCAITDVVRIIERDVGLCAKLLQLVNSAFFGLPRTIASLLEAVTYLGTVTIKNLAMALEAFASASAACGLSQAELLALQDHSLLTGQIARQIQGGDKKKAEEAFLAGVLHEVGWLVRVSDAFSPDAGIEIDRPLLGAYLLGLWGLPHPILEAVAYHQQPDLVPHSELETLDVVHIAHHLASELRGTPSVGRPLDRAFLASLGIDDERIEGMRTLARKVAGIPEA